MKEARGGVWLYISKKNRLFQIVVFLLAQSMLFSCTLLHMYYTALDIPLSISDP